MSRKIKIDPVNFNKHSEIGMGLLETSIREVGVIESICIDKKGEIITGNARFETFEKLGYKPKMIELSENEYPVIQTDLEGEKRVKAAILANTTAKRNIDLDIDLIQEIAIDEFNIDIMELGVDMIDFDLESFSNKSEVGKQGCLSERFIIPPFSILDSKGGKWQDRKNAWLALGIKSEVGRGENLTYSSSAQSPRIYEVRNNIRDKKGYDPSWDEVIDFCKSHNISLQEGTSIFDPVLCELVYRWFNVPSGMILDPFAGGSVRGIVAAKLGMKYYGVDLRTEQIEANYKNAYDVIGEYSEYMPLWMCDDSKNINKQFKNQQFDLVFSCPPYADLEVYSDNPHDLSNMEYGDFVRSYREIINKTCSMLKDNRFAVFVVGEVRNKTGAYYNFIADTIDAFRSAGLSYYNEMILATSIGSMAVRIPRQFNSGRKIGKIHQNVLVFYKGDIKQIKHNYPEIDFSEDDILMQQQ